MTNMGDSKVKRPGSGLISAGLFMAGIGLLLLIVVMTQGNFPGVLVWVLFLGGMVLAVIGFCRRVLAPLEKK